MRPIIAAAALLALAACEPQAPDGAPAPPPADAPAPPADAPVPLPADFAGDLKLVGTEPFWGASIAKGTVTLTRPDHPDVVAPAATPRMEGDRAVWSQHAGEDAFVVTLWKQDCSDGMSDRVYRFFAEIWIDGETLKGCADHTDQLEAQPKP